MIDKETNDFHGAMNKKVTSVSQSMQTKKMTTSNTGSTQCYTLRKSQADMMKFKNVSKNNMAKSDSIKNKAR